MSSRSAETPSSAAFVMEAVMNSVSNDYTAALLRATEDLIEHDTSGLQIGQLSRAVTAARDQILSGYRLLDLELPPPAEFVRVVIDLASQDIALMSTGVAICPAQQLAQ
jgi:hypothetical protein